MLDIFSKRVNKTLSNLAGFYLFVVGGEDDGRNRTELVTIDEAYPVPQCLKSLRDHPNELSFAAGGALSDRGVNCSMPFITSLKKVVSSA